MRQAVLVDVAIKEDEHVRRGTKKVEQQIASEREDNQRGGAVLEGLQVASQKYLDDRHEKNAKRDTLHNDVHNPNSFVVHLLPIFLISIYSKLTSARLQN